LVHTSSGKKINGLVYINRIKPYFYRDELPEDLHVTMEGKEVPLGEAQVQGEVEQSAPVPVPKKVRVKAERKPRTRIKKDQEPVTDEDPRQKGQAGVEVPTEIDEEDEVPDSKTVFAAKCIMKQRQRKGGRRQFLVRWADETSTDSWCEEENVSDALLAHCFITHNQKGLKKKRLNVALIDVCEKWARQKWWEEESPSRRERVDEFGNEL